MPFLQKKYLVPDHLVHYDIVFFHMTAALLGTHIRDARVQLMDISKVLRLFPDAGTCTTFFRTIGSWRARDVQS